VEVRMSNAISYWPECPEIPPPGRFVLICVRTGLPRAEARSQVRTVLRQILAAWSQLSPEQLPLKETPRGPVWQNRLLGDTLDVSLSYAASEAWIALSRGGLIGVDVMRLEPVPEAAAIAQNYFGPADRSALRQSTDPVRDFALAWTQLEARCKCLQQGLTEWSEASATQAQGCSTDSVIVEDRLALSVATASQDFLCRRNA
jgi:4'-phosphopantetheinyl transferase